MLENLGILNVVDLIDHASGWGLDRNHGVSRLNKLVSKLVDWVSRGVFSIVCKLVL